MMYYETIKQLKDSDFKWLNGAQRVSFDLVLKLIEKGFRGYKVEPH